MVPHPFPLSVHLGALAGDLGYFPLGPGPYRPKPDSSSMIDGIRSLHGFGNLVRPLAQTELYLRHQSRQAIPKYVSGRTSYLQV